MSSLSSDLYGLQLDANTVDALARFAKRRRMLLSLRGLAAGLVFFVLTMIVVAACDYLWLLSDGVRWLLSLVGYAITFAAMWWFGLGDLREEDPRSLARRLESVDPRLREDLLSAVELADPNDANGSVSFRDWLQNRVSRRTSLLNIRKLLPVELVRRWLATGAIIAIACLTLLLIPKMQFGRRIARAMLPGIAIERASLTEVTIVNPSPPSGYVAEGDAVGVVVRISGAMVDHASLQWRTDEGLEGESPMSPRVQPSEERSDGVLRKGNVYSANLSVGTVPVEYRIVAGDAITLWHVLTPLPRPAVESFHKRYVFPRYAKLADRVEEAEHGDLKALVGTMAELKVEFDEPVENVTLKFGNRGAPFNLEAVNSTQREFVANIPIKTPAQFQVDAFSIRSGLNNPFSPQYSITPVIDTPPVVNWNPSLSKTMIVSPLDVISLGVSVVDDLPMERVVHEFQVNNEPVVRVALDVAQPAREFDVNWDWDLMRRSSDDPEADKLSGGDIVRTRVVAIDRRRNRGESPFIELLIAEEGFDADRHFRLEQIGGLTTELADWALQAKELLSPLAKLGDQSDAQMVAALKTAKELHEKRGPISERILQLLGTAPNLPESGVLELQGRALLDCDRKMRDWFSRVQHVRGEEHEAWSKSREKWLRTLGGEAKRLAQEASRLEQYVRAFFGEELTVGIVSDAMALHRSLDPLLDEKDVLPPNRFPRFLTVAVGRIDAINQLIEKHHDALPESTQRHLGNWDRWSDAWSARLKASVEDQPKPDDHRKLVTQFAAELRNQFSHSMIDGRLASSIANLLREIRTQMGATSDRVRRMAQSGKTAENARGKAANEDDSDDAAALNRDASFAETQFALRRQGILERLEGEEALHRGRPSLDLQFAADMNLMQRAMKNVTKEGYAPYREESAASVLQQLATAFQTIEAKHEADMWHRELSALMLAERKLDESAVSKIKHPTWIERFVNGLEWPARTLRSVGIEGNLVQAVDQARYNQDLSQARERITSRRWNGDEMLTAQTQLDSLQRYLKSSLDPLADYVDQARATIAKYVLTLPEQAREAAEKTRQAQQRTESRPDSQQETAEKLDAQQKEAEQATRETLESLVDLANTAEIADQKQRELARDADAASAQIQDALQRAQESMEAANDAGDEKQRSEALNETADALEELSTALEQTASHFERAENGEDLAKSREELRRAEAALEHENELENRFDRAQAMAEAAEKSPEELLEQLERELQQNEPMQEELSEISERAAEDAQRALEQAAKDENDLGQSLERSDPTFQERKRRAARQIANLARRAATVDEAILNATERAIGWANEAQLRPKLSEARSEIREVVQKANQMGGENALLENLEQTANEMAEGIESASEMLDQVNEQSEQAEKKDIHKDANSRRRATDQVQRFQRDARTKRIRALNNEKNQWAGAERDAGRRIQQAQRQKRDAERAKRQIEDRMKRDKNQSDALKQQQAQMQRRIDDAVRAEEAARETREFADKKGKETEQRSRDLQKTMFPKLDQPNPAAQLSKVMATEAGRELNEIREELQALAGDADFADELRAPESQARSLASEQQRIEQDVNDVAEQLRRAARHEERLGQQELAQQLNEAADNVAEKAAAAAAAAAQSLEQATDDAAQAPQASRRVAEASREIRNAAQQLAQMLSSGANEEDQPGQQGEPTPTEKRAEQLAQTLDELDRSIAQSQSEQSEQQQQQQQQQGEGQQASAEQGDAQQPGEGQPQGEPTAGEASPTLANAMDAQAQQAARQRQQQMNPAAEGQGDQTGQQSETASSSNPGTQPGMGQMPDGGFLQTSGIERIGSEWGQLRERRTDDAAESRSATISPQYRREIEAYFRAVAKRAAERAK